MLGKLIKSNRYEAWTFSFTMLMVDIKIMKIDVRYQNRCSPAISLKFESVVRKMQSHKYVDMLI